MLTKNLTALLMLCTTLSTGASAQHDHHEHENHQHQTSTPSGSHTKTPGTKPNGEELGPHGGTLGQLGEWQTETVVEPGGLRLFIVDKQGKPLDLRHARGLVMLQVAGDAKRYRYDLFPEIGKDKSAESLAVAVDLSRNGGKQVELHWQVVGLAGADRRPLKFAVQASVPMTEAQQVAAAIAAQRVCPVSNQPLGGMGKPVPVTIGDETIYVCCAGCIDAVKANPAKYLAKPPKLKVAAATEADAAAIKRQKLCPVMDEPLGSMGTPLKVTGLGRDVFLCCKGCLKFLEKEPKKYLAKLPALPKPEVTKATAADAKFAAAQKLCPVMDEPLDAMGGPYRTVVEGRVVYLCCPGCAKKLHATPDEYLAKLAKQGVSPPAAAK